MTLHETQHPYCIGIGGIGVSAIARYFLASNRPVHGSDARPSMVTDRLAQQGATFTIGPPPALPDDTDLVIYSADVPVEHPLRQAAARRGIASLAYADALAQLIAPSDTRIVVTGTNGKSTTTALTGWLFAAAGQDPTVVVGSLVPQLNGNYRPGNGRVAICEGDEYQGHFLSLAPTTAVLTNVEMDHPNYFRDLDDVVAHVRRFLNRLPPDGLVVANGDEPLLGTRLATGHRRVTYAVRANHATLLCWPGLIEKGRRQLSFAYQGTPVGETTFQLPGHYNVANAAAAVLTALEHGLPADRVLAGLASFRGLWRRFEIVGEHARAVIISDYAHHPTAVRHVIAAAREWYPGHQVVVAFQPHNRARFALLRDAFAAALTGDVQLVTEVYAVTGRETGSDAVSARSLVQTIRDQGRDASFVESPEALRQRLRALCQPNTVVLVLGAGDIDHVARTL
ncbi:MAG: UDP-N-acetylmuramate--L-alanine ligase [Candidatus Kerfeldbacteria bacterium]|nr:UDP-N-acetylmuramate--L-alanine ligase [Candidatus Kerfeldbacteria bacterium]